MTKTQEQNETFAVRESASVFEGIMDANQFEMQTINTSLGGIFTGLDQADFNLNLGDVFGGLDAFSDQPNTAKQPSARASRKAQAKAQTKPKTVKQPKAIVEEGSK